jgi:hypothetical protein
VLLPGGLTNHDSLEVAQGLLNLFVAVDDDGVVAPDNVLVGLTDALSGQPLTEILPTDLDLPTTYAEGLAEAQSLMGSAATEFAAASAALSAGDFGQALC